jgi:hypothetical protein
MYLQKVKSKKLFKLIIFCWRLEGHQRKEQDPDLDPGQYQNVMNPEHWKFLQFFSWAYLTSLIQRIEIFVILAPSVPICFSLTYYRCVVLSVEKIVSFV